jgi:ribosomal protein S18 acetylase RimI-like enzyme
MTQGVSVRAATLADLADLIHLETLFPEGDRISARSWRRFMAREGCVVVASEMGAPEVLGAAVILTRKGSQTARIYSLAVDPHAQGRGVGRMLVEAAVARAQAAGCTRLSLEVRPDNAAARTLYRTCGFEDRGVMPEHYADGTAALIMDKEVPSGPVETKTQ